LAKLSQSSAIAIAIVYTGCSLQKTRLRPPENRVMLEPTLYQEYERHEALSLFGSEADSQSLCDGQWIILPKVILCFTVLGDWPKMSHFKSASRFCWVADKPYQAGDRQLYAAVPNEIRAGQTVDRLILLFVRKKDGTRFVFLGKLAPAYSFGVRGKHDYGNADLALSPTLPSRVWADLGGLRPGDLDHAAVDAALDILRKPATVEDRLSVLRRLVEYWHGPIRPADGFSEDDLQHVRMPDVLKLWYRWAGRRKEIMSGQNFLRDPDELKLTPDGRLVFYVENQGCYYWATGADGDDPPVFGRESESDPWEPENKSLSEHLIIACIFEAVMCHSPYGAWDVGLGEDAMTKVAEVIRPFPIPPWGWYQMQFWAGNGVFAIVHDNGEDYGKRVYGVYLGAKTEQPLAFLKSIPHDNWEYQAF
jgi:hypothetical protein